MNTVYVPPKGTAAGGASPKATRGARQGAIAATGKVANGYTPRALKLILGPFLLNQALFLSLFLFCRHEKQNRNFFFFFGSDIRELNQEQQKRTSPRIFSLSGDV